MAEIIEMTREQQGAELQENLVSAIAHAVKNDLDLILAECERRERMDEEYARLKRQLYAEIETLMREAEATIRKIRLLMRRGI